MLRFLLTQNHARYLGYLDQDLLFGLFGPWLLAMHSHYISTS